MTASDNRLPHWFSLAWRSLLPVVVLAAAAWGFWELAKQAPQEPPPEREVRTLRTRVMPLKPTDYPVIVRTNGVVQAHNLVTLAAEVSGIITHVSPKFEVGAHFSAGEVLLEIDPRNYETAIAMAESRLAAARSALELARLDEQRKLRLVDRDAVSRAEADVASATREQRESDVALASAELQQAKVNLQRTQVVAPFDGRVQTKSIGLGQMATANSPLGQIFAVEFVEVRLPVSARQRQYLQLPEFEDDPPLDVVFRDAISDQSTTAWRGKIVRTEGVLDADSRDVFAIARVDDPFGRKSQLPPLRIGQPVVASIAGDTLRDVIALPRPAVRQLDTVVLVKQADQTLLPKTIQSIWSDAEHVIVPTTQIPDGMWLATTPLVYTPEGATVEIIPEASTAVSIADSTAEGATDNSTN
jgi:RND family efflux transporter MFP subunit